MKVGTAWSPLLSLKQKGLVYMQTHCAAGLGAAGSQAACPRCSGLLLPWGIGAQGLDPEISPGAQARISVYVYCLATLICHEKFQWVTHFVLISFLSQFCLT